MTAVGIDLGTTNTVVGAVRDGRAVTLSDDAGRRLIPSIVSFHPTGKVLVGHAAKDRRLNDPLNTVYSVKRLIGRSWNSPEVQEAKGKFPFKLKEGPKFGTLVTARSEDYTLPEISAFVLRQAKAVADAAMAGGEPVSRAVITVPANFNDLQRAATKVAGKLAGLEVLRILNEPTAAALAYGTQAPGASERIAIYDLGGGTFDITILDLSGSVFEVLATAGDMQLGGDDIDLLVAERMAEACMKQHRFDPRADAHAFGMLRITAESIKRDLSTTMETGVELADLVPEGAGKSPTLSFRMTRAELEALMKPLVDRTFKTCQQALDSAQLTVGAINRAILVGGSTRAPVIARRVEAFFERPPFLKINPDEVVALGAAIQASSLDRRTRKTVKRSPGSVATALPGPSFVSESSIVASVPQPYSPSPSAPPASTGTPSFHAISGAQSNVVSFEVPTPDDLVEDLSDEVDAHADGPSTTPFFGPASTSAMMPPHRAPQGTLLGTGETQSGGLDFARPSPVLEFPSLPESMPAGGGGYAFDDPPAARTTEKSSSFAGGSFGSALTRAADLAAAQAAAPPPLAAMTRGAPLLIDVTPLSLSVETVGDFCDVLIEHNMPVPCDKTRVFSTARDNQTSVVIRVAQGEEPRFSANTYLGELELTGIPEASRGEVQIAVTFEIDADGILNVKARDQGTGNETRAKMNLVGAQNEAHEIDAMARRQAQKPLG